MLKKFMLSAVVLCTAMSLAAAPKVMIDQSSKKALAESFVKVICNGDVDGFKALCVPGHASTVQETLSIIANRRLQMIDILNVLANELKKDCNVNDPSQILRDSAKFRKATDTIMNDAKYFIQLNGKWYAYMPVIKHDSQEMIAAFFMMAYQNGDAITLFEISSPKDKSNWINTHGSKEKAIEFLDTKLSAAREKNSGKKVDLFNTQERKACVDALSEKNAVVKINGKWYIQF